MGFKEFLSVFLTATVILIFEFVFIPILGRRLGILKTEELTVVEKSEKIKFDLVYILKDAGFEIFHGPFSKEEMGSVEVVLNIEKRPVKVLFSSIIEPRQQLTSLQLILKEAKIQNEAKGIDGLPKLIDLTTDKPYVAF